MIVCHLVEVVLISALGLLLRWENKRRDRIQSQMAGGLEGRDLDSTAFLDLTDRENLKYAMPFFAVRVCHCICDANCCLLIASGIFTSFFLQRVLSFGS